MKIMIDCWFFQFFLKVLGFVVISGVVLRCKVINLFFIFFSSLNILYIVIGSSLKFLIEIKGYVIGV